MTPADHDELRAAAALVAIAADRPSCPLRAVVLGADPDTDRSAGIAWTLAYWLAEEIRSGGVDPRELALLVIADSIGAEATEGDTS